MTIPINVNDRGSGKTETAIDWVAQATASRAVIVATGVLARHLLSRARRQHPDRDWAEWNFTSIHDAPRLLLGRGVRDVYIDQADDVLRSLLRVYRIVGASWTTHDSPENPLRQAKAVQAILDAQAEGRRAEEALAVAQEDIVNAQVALSLARARERDARAAL